MSEITIYHNPNCGTSRNVLGLIRSSGADPEVIEYLKTPPDRDTLKSLIDAMGISVRDLLRVKGTPYVELGLKDPKWTDEQLIGFMLEHPVLINRPIVVAPLGTRLCRPSDTVLELLARRPRGDVSKEDGSPLLIDERIAGSDPELATALRAADLPIDDLTEPGRYFFRYRTLSGRHVGYGGFEHLGRDILLRSLVVAPQARGRGIGHGILALLLRRAFDEGGRDAWLLTTSAADFFDSAGFKRVERSDAPATVLATRQAASLCPASAVLLKRAISL